MELSKETQDILKNFSEINQSLAFKEGVLKQYHLKKYFSKTMKEHFPQDLRL